MQYVVIQGTWDMGMGMGTLDGHGVIDAPRHGKQYTEYKLQALHSSCRDTRVAAEVLKLLT